MIASTVHHRVWLRFVGAFLVGCVVTPVAALTLLSLGFGGASAGLPYVGVLFALGTLLLAGVHQLTGTDSRPRVALSLAWGLGVLVLSLVLVAGFATAWQRSSFEFGRWQLLWWLFAGVGFALAAALATRRTVLPAVAVFLVLAVGALTVSGFWRTVRADDGESTWVRPSLVYVTAIPDYDDGTRRSGLAGPAVVYEPVDASPLDETGRDSSVLLTTQEPPTAPAPCGRTEPLPFDQGDQATCTELGPDTYLRDAGRYREVVRVEPDSVVTATGSRSVPVEVLAAAAKSAQPATNTDLDRLYAGWDKE